MIIKIIIDKNDNDDWSVSSPFSGYTSTAGFLISNDASATYGLYEPVPNIFFSCGSISRNVEIMDEGKFDRDIELTGIGGLSKVGDWMFEIENISGITSPMEVIGRKVTLVIDSSQVYVGRIYRCEPLRKRIKFHVRSNFLLWDKKIGTILESDIKESNNKIYPIIYGDFTTDDSYIPLLLDVTDDYTIEGYTSVSENIEEISNIYVWDADRQTADQCTNGLDDITIETGNKKVTFKTNLGIITTEAIGNTTDLDSIYIDAMPVIGFKLTTSPTFTVNDLFYTDTTSYGRNYYKFIEEKGGIYLFEVGKRDTDIDYFINEKNGEWDTLKPDSSGTLTKVSDSSTYTVSGSNISDVQVPSLYARQKGENYKSTIFEIAGSEEGLEYDYKKPVKSQIIQIEDEKMLIYRSLAMWSSSKAMHSKHEVIRGYSNTTRASHTSPQFVYTKQDTENNLEYLLKMKTVIPVAGLSNWKSLFVLDASGTYNYEASKVVSEMATIENLDNLLHNFLYQQSTISPWLNAFKVTFEDFSSLSFSPYSDGMGTLTDIRATLLLDIDLGPASKIKGHITGIWLLGSYEIDHANVLLMFTNPASDWDNKITLGMRATDDTDNYKRVGINLFNAYLLGLNPDKEFTGKNNYALSYGVVRTSKVMSHIVNADRSYNSRTFYLYANNPVTDADNWEKSFPISGSWNYSTSPTWKYEMGTIQSPRMPQTLDEFFKQKFVFQLHGQSEFQFYINNAGFLIEYNIDIREIPLWFKGKGRMDIYSSLLTTPVHVIENILTKELDIIGADIDTVSFAANKNYTVHQTCAFALYNEPIMSSKIFKTICKEQGLILGETATGDVYVSSLNNQTVDYDILNTDLLLSADNLPYFEEGFTGVDKLITELTIKYKKRYTDNNFIEQNVSGSEFDGAEDYTDQERKAVINAETIRDSTTAGILNTICNNFYKEPLRKLVVHCNPTNTMTLVPGNKVTFNSETYVPDTDGRIFIIVGTSFQPGFGTTKPEVVLTLLSYASEVETVTVLQDTDGSSTKHQDTDGSSTKYQM